MRKYQKMFSVILSAALAGSLMTMPVLAEEEGTEEASMSESFEGDDGLHLAIIHTNDTHGRAANEEATEDSAGCVGFAGVAAIRDWYLNEGYDVLLVDAGDFSQGTTLVNLNKGINGFNILDKTGYDVVVPGNHEFDWGADVLQENYKSTELNMISANIIVDESGETLFDPSVYYDLSDGTRIGFFGLSTPETAVKTNPKNVAGLTFLSGQELYDAAQEQIDALVNDAGCDIVVCLGHMGIDEESAPNRSTDVIENTTGIDIFIDGHSHSDIAETVNDTFLVSTGEYLENVGVTVIEGGEITEYGISAADFDLECDADITKLVDDYVAENEKEMSVVIGKSDVDLNGERDPGVRTEETNLGDLVADAVLWQAQQVFGDVDCAFTNGGGIRASVAAGDITKDTLFTVLPFENYVSVMDVSGETLLEVIEAACSAAPTAIGAFPQVSGLTFTVDTTVAYENGEPYGDDGTYFAPAAPGSRVTIEKVGDKDFALDGTYRIAVNDFMASGGDTYYRLAEAYTESGSTTGVLMSDALINYVTEELGGTIGDTYAAPMGRITIVK